MTHTDRDPTAGCPRRSRARATACACALAWATLVMAPAHAERADRNKEAYVTADHSTLDDLTQVEVLTGHVLLVKGTMRLTGDRMVHRQDPEGYQHYVATADPGNLARYHERRDPVRPGVISTIDGAAERIDYDDKSDKVIMTGNAIVKRFDNGVLQDELQGARIVYNERDATYDVTSGKSSAGDGRVHIRIAPRGPAVAGTSQAVGLRPAETSPAAAASAAIPATPSAAPAGTSTAPARAPAVPAGAATAPAKASAVPAATATEGGK